jgi:hypothetical protein
MGVLRPHLESVENARLVHVTELCEVLHANENVRVAELWLRVVGALARSLKEGTE